MPTGLFCCYVKSIPNTCAVFEKTFSTLLGYKCVTVPLFAVALYQSTCQADHEHGLTS